MPENSTLNSTLNNTPTWRAIQQQGYILPIIILCLGIWLHATDYSFAATIVPLMVKEIGGVKLVNWIVSVYEIGTITASISASILVKRFNLITLGKMAALLFATGCIITALATHMEIIIFSRLLQGLGAGTMVALAIMTISTIFPPTFFIRLMSLVSVVWGVSYFAGPLIGAGFAEFSIWRWGFIFMAIQALMIITAYSLILAPFLKAKHNKALKKNKNPPRIPIIRIIFIATSILFISAAGLTQNYLITSMLIIAGITLFITMLKRDKNSKVNILPQAMFTHSPSGIGMTTALIAPMATITISTYAPVFTQTLFNTPPIINGYIISLIAISWSLAAVTASNMQQFSHIFIRCGLIIVIASQIIIAMGFYLKILPLIPIGAIIEGTGFGMCWAFIAQRTIQLAPKNQQKKISTSIFTMQRIGYAMGAALLGIIVNGLGFNLNLKPQAIQNIAAITFISLIPLILISVYYAWKLAKIPLPKQ